MERKEYSAGAVSHSFWFMEFKNIVKLLAEGKTLEEVKELNQKENIVAAPTPQSARRIFNGVSGRIKELDASFYPIFMSGDIATQKLFDLVAIMNYDTLFFEFMYEVVREKMIIGSNELTDADFRVFFKNKQLQDEKIAAWTDQTIRRLSTFYKTVLFEAGITDKAKDTKKIYKPLLDIEMERWLIDQGMEQIVKALSGVR